jgi:antitoxin component YwqK of YwqJK toxin-antitoxin module
MIKYLFLSLLAICAHTCMYAQTEITFPYTSEDDNRLISETDSGKYYVADGDTTNIVFINDDGTSCRVMNSNHKVLCEGGLNNSQDQYLQDGKWTEYYPDGKIKTTGYYYLGKPMGTWVHYYSSGKPKSEYSYAIISENGSNNACLNGVYKEYYKSGKLKVQGFYKVDIDGTMNDTIMVKDPVTMTNKMVIQKVRAVQPEKIGKWEEYAENGATPQKEDEAAPKKEDETGSQKNDDATPKKDDDD